MSLLVLDEQLDLSTVRAPVARLFSVRRVSELRPGELIRDERVPSLLLELDRPTLITIDHDLCRRQLCHPRYCILYFALIDTEQELLPELLRRVLRLKGFQTRAARMGKVARVTRSRVDFWEFGVQERQTIQWDE